MTEAIIRVRNLIGDILTVVPNDTQEYLGGSKIFNLMYSTIDSSTLVVYKNGTIWTSGNYSYSSVTGKVTVTGTLTTGDVLNFQYSAYTKYSDSELKGYIRSALYHLAVEKYRVFTAKSDDIIFPTASDAEYSLISIVAAILIKGNIKQYRTPEFTIIFDTDNMSVEKKIKTVLNQYKKSFGYITYVDLTAEMAETEDD
jgi:hypothetical protein